MGIKKLLKQIDEYADSLNKTNNNNNNIQKNKIFNENLSGANTYDENKIQKGKILYNGKLIDKTGKILKNYKYKYIGIIDKNNKNNYIAQKSYESPNWGMFDEHDNPIWVNDTSAIHHDIQITNKNTIITLNKESHKYKNRMVEFDTIEEYDLTGKLLETWSSWKNFKQIKKYHKSLNLDFPKLFPKLKFDFCKSKNTSIWDGNYDYYHFNSIQTLPKNKLEKTDKRFQNGNLLISCRHGSMIFILDKKTKQIVWFISQFDIKDEIQGQHGPKMLKNGNILIFDNGRYRKWSRVIELNPISLNIEWEYKKENFFTEAQGFAQKLENGNILITESEKGRIFEITKQKELVWEYYTPFKQNKTNSSFPSHYGKREWIYRATHY